MELNDFIQWVCVAIVFVVVIVAAVKHVVSMVRWSRRIKQPGGNTLPPCCGGKAKNTSSSKETTPPSKRANNLCGGCQNDCPLSENRSKCS